MNKFLVKTLVGTMLTGAFLIGDETVSANTYDDRINELGGQLSKVDAEQQQIRAELVTLENKISDNQSKIQKLLKSIEESQLEKQNLEKEIAVLEENIAARNDKIENQFRSIQVSGDPTNYIEFIVNSDSLTDILGRLNVVENIVSANKDLVEEQKMDKESVVLKKEETELKINEQNDASGELESLSAELKEQQLMKESVVAELASQRATIESEKEYYLTLKEEAEAERAQVVAAREVAAEASQNIIAQTSSENTQSVQKVAAKPAAPKPTVSGSNVQSIANSVLGVGYYYGGSTTNGFDCSGFTSYVFNKVGKSLPRSAAGQYASATKVSSPQPGDLVFFSGNGRSVTHVGIYTGGGQFIGSQSSTGVAYTRVNSSYWGPKLVGYGRY
ncbi:C40 family peptidase [Lacticigenium naphthae]|uniref:C40 family peptidase n=1 Tax=Lacticigenium naphthae TaxID=515351 RepID=UPI0004891D32|nr:C40 family peptidase [Lacticigenium naphthae]